VITWTGAPVRRYALVLVAAGGTLLLGACGTSPNASSGATGKAAASGSDAVTAFQQCLSEHGLNIPAGGFGRGPGGAPSGAPTSAPPPGAGAPSGLPSALPTGAPPGGQPLGGQGPGGAAPSAFASAMAACASLRPSGLPAGGSPGAVPSGAASARAGTVSAAYRSCLKDHGVTLADGAPVSSLDTNDATVKTALATCAPLATGG
jgi:hypothetical protein